MKTPNHPILLKTTVYALSLLLMLHAVSCTYFKTEPISSDIEVTLNQIGKIHKYFVVHDGRDLYHLIDLKVDSTYLSGSLEKIDQPIFYNVNRPKRILKEEHTILNEVHIYLKEEAPFLELGYADIPLTQVHELRIIDKNSGATVASYVLGTVGVIAGALAILVIIVLATKSSCPYVYTHDGEAFVFTGETFGGAIGANLARDDYMPLPALQAVNDTYRLRISNELKERQYTDVAELIAVNHAADQKVMLDKHGEVQLLENLQHATEAHSFNGVNRLSSLAENDDDKYLFNDEDYSENGLILKFDKPADARLGKLLLTAQNTLWFDYLFGEFLEKFGGAYERWMDKQYQLPTAERMQTIVDHNFPLSIYVKQAGEWQLVDYLPTVGPLAAREFLIPIDLTNFSEKEIEIKIETGFMFWEIDAVAMDFTENIRLESTRVQAHQAYGSGQKDWTTQLAKIDQQYMAQETIGEVTELLFSAPPVPEGQTQTVFLHTRGYYELIRDFKGLPKITELNKFKDPSYFSAYSRANYLVATTQEETEVLQ